MIVTKQRKSFQSSSPYTRGEKYRYVNDYPDGLSRDYLLERQSVPINYGQRERHSISTVSPIPKKTQNYANSYTKKTDKKYDYSLNLDRSIQNDYLNKTHEKIHEKYRYQPQPKRQTFKADFTLDHYEKKRIQSVNQTSSKRPSTETKPRYYQKPYDEQSRKRQDQDEKIDIKSYLKNYEPRYDSALKQQPKYKNNFAQTKQKNCLERNPLMSQNFIEDNFGATEKFKQFKQSNNQSNQYQDSKARPKYEAKYAGMRTNKRYQIKKEQPQEQKTSKTKVDNKENSAFDKPLDVQKLLKDSNAQNINIVEKINRIQKLNHQISKRLESMLNRKQVVS